MGENAKIGSTTLFIIGMAIVMVGVANFVVNTEPSLQYLKGTIKYLKDAQTEPSLEGKKELISNALNVYQNRSWTHWQGLKTLLSLNSTSEINYWLPTLISAIDSEYNSLILPFKGILQMALVFLFTLTSAWGSFHDYDEWDTDEQHAYITLLFGFGLSMFVSLIP